MGLNTEWTELRMGLNLEWTKRRTGLNLEFLSTSNGTISIAVKNIFIVSNFFNMELNSYVEALITFFD